MVKSHFFPPIGLAGAAGVGKDTLCNYIINHNDRPFKRYSIAGDIIKKDLKPILKKTAGIDPFTTNLKAKTIIRPLLVEYGRLLRKTTKGRYFIEKLQKDKNFGKNHIPIITDIRYAEYPKDEMFWIKEEINGLLVFLEREGIEPANEFEEHNNKILKINSNLYFKIPTDIDHIKVYQDVAKKIIKCYDKSPFTNRTFFSL